MLQLDPNKRVKPDVALSHEWFREEPKPMEFDLMPTFPARNEVARNDRKRMKKTF